MNDGGVCRTTLATPGLLKTGLTMSRKFESPIQKLRNLTVYITEREADIIGS